MLGRVASAAGRRSSSLSLARCSSASSRSHSVVVCRSATTTTCTFAPRRHFASQQKQQTPKQEQKQKPGSGVSTSGQVPGVPTADSAALTSSSSSSDSDGSTSSGTSDEDVESWDEQETRMWKHCCDAKVGEKAPYFRAPALMPDGSTKTLKLSDYHGKWLVMLFYPRDFTLVCPTEIIAFSDASAEFAKRGAEVLACSTDSVECHAAWCRQPRSEGGLGKMNIPILSDSTHDVSRDYGVLKADAGLAYRGLYVVDPKHKLRIAHIHDLPIGRNVDEALRILDALNFYEKEGEVCPSGWKAGQRGIDPQSPAKYFKKADQHKK